MKNKIVITENHIKHQIKIMPRFINSLLRLLFWVVFWHITRLSCGYVSYQFLVEILNRLQESLGAQISDLVLFFLYSWKNVLF